MVEHHEDTIKWVEPVEPKDPVIQKLDEAIKLDKAVANFRKLVELRSFSARHPELGKMINCPVCNLRHRSSQVCVQRFATETREGEPLQGELKVLDYLTDFTFNQKFGARMFKGKRRKPHHSKRLLHILQRMVELYPSEEGLWPSTETKTADRVAMEVCRRRAKAEVKMKRDAKRTARQQMAHHSRQVNRGLF